MSQTTEVTQAATPMDRLDAMTDLLCMPNDHAGVRRQGERLETEDGRVIRLENGVPLFAEAACSADAMAQQEHYSKVATDYLAHLDYPQTEEYNRFFDRVTLQEVMPGDLGTVAELCCGRGEAFLLIGKDIARGVGVDISLPMIRQAQQEHGASPIAFIQGDATMLPLKSNSFDSVFMLAGIHHVNNRLGLFNEIRRILKPGGRFYYREPVSDFWLWRLLRAVVYRLSPALDHETERPLLRRETEPVLRAAGMEPTVWKTYGFLGFCLLMNSDVLVFNRFLRHLPGIRAITRGFVWLDRMMLSIPGLRGAGTQVVGVARKPDV